MATSDPPPSSFAAAYLATHYIVQAPEGEICLRIGAANAALDRLLEHAHSETWAFITAHNPRSRLLTPAENAKRNRRLMRRVEQMGLEYLPGRGVGDRDDWPAEESLLILGTSEGQAGALGAEFGQNAVVAGRRGEAPRLVWCRLCLD